MRLSETYSETSLCDNTVEFRLAPTSFQPGDSSKDCLECPGGCGGLAKLENPHTVTRDGITQTYRMAECLGSCKMEKRTALSKKPKLVAARFEVPWIEVIDSPVSEPEADIEEDLSQILARALAQSQTTQIEAGTQIGCSQSSVSKMLRGLPVSETTTKAAWAWSLAVLDGREYHPLLDLENPSMISIEGTTKAPVTCRPSALTPYESILRTMLEQVAQERLEQIAGPAAKGIVARVSLEWSTDA